jgi:hypothetical protein
MFVFSAALSVTAAVCLLSLTIFQLSGPSDASALVDSSTPNLAAHPSAIITFAFLALALVVIIAAFTLYTVARHGFKTIKRGFFGRKGPDGGLKASEHFFVWGLTSDFSRVYGTPLHTRHLGKNRLCAGLTVQGWSFELLNT